MPEAGISVRQISSGKLRVEPTQMTAEGGPVFPRLKVPVQLDFNPIVGGQQDQCFTILGIECREQRILGGQEEPGRMAKKELFVERREEEGDYAIRGPRSKRPTDVKPTQAEAIERAAEIDPNATIHVERVRKTTKGSRDKWRKP